MSPALGSSTHSDRDLPCQHLNLDLQHSGISSMAGSGASVPPSLDGQCPSCNRRFDSNASILRYMNHPWSLCTTWFELFNSISPPTQCSSPCNRPNHSSHNNDTSHNNNASHNEEPMLNDDAVGDLDVPLFEDVHPNVPQVIGSGMGFTEVFHSDHHAEKRKDDLYHPFSSRDKRGLASRLSRSGLSMRAINNFLALPVVRTKNITTNILLIRYQGPEAITFLHNSENALQLHGTPSQGTRLENTNNFPQWVCVRATLLFGSQRAMSVRVRYPIPVGHCQ